jgi:hypothetical protein
VKLEAAAGEGLGALQELRLVEAGGEIDERLGGAEPAQVFD